MTRTRLLLLVALLALVAVPVVVLLRVGDPAGSAATRPRIRPPSPTGSRPRTPPRTPPWTTPTPRPCGCCTPGTPAAPTPAQPGSPARLRALYVSGSAAGEADVRLLRALPRPAVSG